MKGFAETEGEVCPDCKAGPGRENACLGVGTPYQTSSVILRRKFFNWLARPAKTLTTRPWVRPHAAVVLQMTLRAASIDVVTGRRWLRP